MPVSLTHRVPVAEADSAYDYVHPGDSEEIVLEERREMRVLRHSRGFSGVVGAHIPWLNGAKKEEFGCGTWPGMYAREDDVRFREGTVTYLKNYTHPRFRGVGMVPADVDPGLASFQWSNAAFVAPTLPASYA